MTKCNCKTPKHALGCFNRKNVPLQTKKPMKRGKALNRIGKVGAQWIEDRHEWIKNNPPDHAGYWYCYLQISPNCQRRMTIETLTLDHVKGRGRHPHLRRDQKNFKPACAPCNELKGSKELEEVQ